jgi:hypothetical protein
MGVFDQKIELDPRRQVRIKIFRMPAEEFQQSDVDRIWRLWFVLDSNNILEAIFEQLLQPGPRLALRQS